MRAKRIRFLIPFILVLLLVTGCWDSRDIEDKDICTAVVVDRTDAGYAFYVEIAAIGQKDQERPEGAKSRMLSSQGRDLVEAREDLDRKSDKPIYLGAVQGVVLTQGMAYSGIEEYMYRLRQLPEYRKTVDVVITTSKPEEIMQASMDNDALVGFSIEDTLQGLVDTGQSFHYSLADLLETLASPCKSYILPTIGVKDGEIALTGFSPFYKGDCIGFIPAEEAEGIVMMKADEPVLLFKVPCMDTFVTAEVRMTKRNIKASYQNGRIGFKVDYECDATLLYLERNLPVNEQAAKIVMHELKSAITQQLNDAIAVSQNEYACDYFNFFSTFRIKYPDVMKNLDWHEAYPRASISLDVKVDLDTVGNMDYNPRTEENEEKKQDR